MCVRLVIIFSAPTPPLSLFAADVWRRSSKVKSVYARIYETRVLPGVAARPRATIKNIRVRVVPMK